MMMGASSAVGYGASAHASAGIQGGAEDNELKRRMDFACDVNMCLNGDVYQFVDDALRAAYHVETYQKMALQSGISTRLNPMVRGVAKADKSWCGGSGGEQAADYTLEGAADGGGEVFKRHIANAKIDMVTRECSKRMWVHMGFCGAPLVVGDRFGDKPRHFVTRLFTPDRFNAVPYPKSPGVLQRLELFSHDPTCDKPFERIDWTEETWSRWVRKNEDERWQKSEEEPNEFGVIPGVLARPNPFLLWADNYGAQLFESTIRINAAQTLLTYNSHSQVKAMFGPFKGAPNAQVIGQAALIDSGGQAGSLIDFTTDQEQFRKTHVSGEWQMIAELLGFPADEFDGTAVPQSGEALKIRYHTALQQAMARQWWLIKFAQDLYWLGLQVLAYELLFPAPVVGYEDRKLPPYAPGVPVEKQPVRLVVKPKMVTLPQLATEVAAAEDRDIELGFKSRVDLMMERNPGMTAEEAEARMRANAKINSSLGDTQDQETTDVAPKEDGNDQAKPGATDAGDPAAQVDASGKVAAGTAAAVTLNGAQITAALEVVSMLSAGSLSHITAVELLVAVGIERTQAEKMVTAEEKRPRVPAPAHPPQRPAFGATPIEEP